MLYKVTFSPTGGTEKVVSILGDYLNESLKEEMESVDLVRRDLEARHANIRSNDLVIIGMPSYGGRVPAIASSRLRMLQGSGAKAIVVAVYGNRAYDDTLLELRNVASDSGFKVIGAVAAVAEHSIVRDIAQGRPDDQDMDQLKEIAEKIIDKFESQDNHLPEVPGSHPYKIFHGIPLRTFATDACIFCTACAFVCPVGAIPMETPNVPSNGSCISCMKCVQICPAQARYAQRDLVEAIGKKLAPVCADRKECELYL